MKSVYQSMKRRILLILSEYTQSYIDTKAKGDKAKMQQIEKDLEKLGMDKMTLLTVVAEEEKNL